MSEDDDMRQRCLARLQTVFRAVFDDPQLTLSEGSSQRDIPEWNRSSHLELVTAIEKAFGVRLTTREAWETGAATSTVGSLLQALTPKMEEAVQGFRASLDRAVSDGERQRLLETCICGRLATLLELEPAEIDASRTFQDLGLTSLGAVELCSRLELDLGLAIAPTLVFNYPSPAKAAAHLASRFGMRSESTVASRGADALSSILQDIDQMSEEEAARLLSGESRGGASSSG